MSGSRAGRHGPMRRRVGRVGIAVALLLLAGCATPAPSSAPPSTSPPPTGATPAAATTDLPTNPDDAAVLSPLAVTPLAPRIDPVLGADDRLHLAYELQLVNQSSSTVDVGSVATVDPADGVVSTLQGADLGRLIQGAGGPDGTRFEPGQAATLFLDATLPAGAPVPAYIRNRFTLGVRPAQPVEPGPRDDDPAPPPATTTVFTGVPVRVSAEPAVQVAPPLDGARWVIGNGCCNAITAHRGATLSTDGTVRVAQRFAIDFVQLGPGGQLYAGDPANNTSFPYFGTPIHSVADGTVVRVRDGSPNQTPGKLPEGQTLSSADGNYVVIDIGNGRFAFYAHMQPGSIRVKVGDRVRTRDVLGLLGNSGNTDAPHLHFHVMDGPSPLQSNGLPFVLTSFTGRGVVTDEKDLGSPFPAQAPVVPVDPARLAGPHTGQLPLNLEVVDFP